MAAKVVIQIDIEKGENSYEFPDTEEGRRILNSLRDEMNSKQLYFQTLFANRMIIKVFDKEAIMFVNQFLDERATKPEL